MQKKQLNKNIEMSPLVPGLNGDDCQEGQTFWQKFIIIYKFLMIKNKITFLTGRTNHMNKFNKIHILKS